jgi:hypothetical protein
MLPAAAERAVQTDGLPRHLCFGTHEVEVDLERPTFGVEHLEELDKTAFVDLSDEVRGVHGGVSRLHELAPAQLLLAVSDERALDIFDSEEDGLLIPGVLRVDARFGSLDTGPERAPAEHRPPDGRPDGKEAALGLEEITEAHALEATGSGQEEAGVEIGGYDTDVRRGRVQASFSGAYVRAAQEQLGWKPDWNQVAPDH